MWINKTIRRIYLIGIAGTGMGAFAGLLKQAGFEVTGSDTHAYPPMGEKLQEWGIPIKTPFSIDNLKEAPDLVIVGNVVGRDNIEASYVREHNIPMTSFPEGLYHLFLKQSIPIVVAGTHGKTTTSALLAHTLFSAGCPTSFLIGGIPLNFNESFRWSPSQSPSYFVVEGDEYDTAYFDKGPKFLHYAPEYLLSTSLEYDHADIYKNVEQIAARFSELFALVPPSGQIVMCADWVWLKKAVDAACIQAPLMCYGEKGEWRPVGIREDEWGVSFSIMQKDCLEGFIQLPLSGEHNVYNALGCYALLRGLSLSHDAIAQGFLSFKGVKRRLEVVGTADDVIVIDDFAHHPTAVATTLTGAKNRYPHRPLWVLFEPRSATSARRVFQDAYTQSFHQAQKVFIAPVGRQLEKEEKLDVELLAHRITQAGTLACSASSLDELADEVIATVPSGAVILCMSNGAFGGIDAFAMDPPKGSNGSSHSSSSSSSSKRSSSVLYPHDKDPDRIKIRDLLIPPPLLTPLKTRWVDPLSGIAQGALRISRGVFDGALSVFQRLGLVAPLNKEELQKLQEERNDETVNTALQLAMANMQTLLIVLPQNGGKEEENTGKNTEQVNTLLVEELRQHIREELNRYAQMQGIHIRSIRIATGNFYPRRKSKELSNLHLADQNPILVTRDLIDYMESEFPSLEYVEVDGNRFLIKELGDPESAVHYSLGFSPSGFHLRNPGDLTPYHITKLIYEAREPTLDGFSVYFRIMKWLRGPDWIRQDPSSFEVKDLVLLNQRRLRLIELSFLYMSRWRPHNLAISYVINDLINPENGADNWARIQGVIWLEMFKRRYNEFYGKEGPSEYGRIPSALEWREGSRRHDLEWILSEDSKASTSQCIEARLLLDSGDSNYDEIESLTKEKVESILRHIDIILDPASPAYYFQRGMALETLARINRYHPLLVRPFLGALKMAQYIKNYIRRAETFEWGPMGADLLPQLAREEYRDVLANKMLLAQMRLFQEVITDEILTKEKAIQYLEELKQYGDYAKEANSLTGELVKKNFSSKITVREGA